jgi:hypothetical protein
LRLILVVVSRYSWHVFPFPILIIFLHWENYFWIKFSFYNHAKEKKCQIHKKMTQFRLNVCNLQPFILIPKPNNCLEKICCGWLFRVQKGKQQKETQKKVFATFSSSFLASPRNEKKKTFIRKSIKTRTLCKYAIILIPLTHGRKWIETTEKVARIIQIRKLWKKENLWTFFSHFLLCVRMKREKN